MPVSTVLPAVSIETMDDHFFAMHAINAAPGTFSGIQLHFAERHETLPDGLDGGGYGLIGGIGSTFEVQANSGGAPGNMFMTRVITTVNGGGGGGISEFARPSYGPASEWAPGAGTAPACVVQVYSVIWANTDTVDNWPIDTTGFCFIPQGFNLTSNYIDALRTGASPLNGMGIFNNSDGAGGVRVEYVAWNGAVATERVPVPAGAIADVSDYNTMRFVIVGAASGREATLSVTVNGVAVVTGREFGSAELVRPDAQDVRALQYVIGVAAGPGGGEGFFYSQFGYHGRFTPDGVEQQPFGA